MTEEKARSLHYERIIREYWEKNWPKMVARMKKKGTCEKRVQSLAREVSDLVASAAEKGLDHWQAEEFARQMYQHPGGSPFYSEEERDSMDENGYYK